MNMDDLQCHAARIAMERRTTNVNERNVDCLSVNVVPAFAGRVRASFVMVLAGRITTKPNAYSQRVALGPRMLTPKT